MKTGYLPFIVAEKILLTGIFLEYWFNIAYWYLSGNEVFCLKSERMKK